MEIITLQKAKQGREGIYQDKKIVLLDDLRHIDKTLEGSVMVDCFLLTLVKKGHAVIQLNDFTCEMRENDLFACLPRTVSEKTMISPDFDAYIFLASPEYAGEVLKQTQLTFSLPLLEKVNTVLHLNDSEVSVISGLYNLLHTLYQMAPTHNNSLAIESLLHSFVYKCVDIFESHEKTSSPRSLSSAENILSDFLFMLHKPGVPFLSVSEYAEQLHITPKYFTSVCKKVAGKSANKIIEEMIISSAKMMLRNKRLSIKQVALQLGFANQSHFGVFFRRHTGISPQQFRQTPE